MDTKSSLSGNFNMIDSMQDSDNDTRHKYDEIGKRILSYTEVLARILHFCVEEYRNCPADEIAEKYINNNIECSQTPVNMDEGVPDSIDSLNSEDSSLDEGIVRYDIRFTAKLPDSDEDVGLIINVEAQSEPNPGYSLVRRALYYCTRMISSQHGKYFKNSHYENIRKVYSIWICLNPPKKRKDSIVEYYIGERHLKNGVCEDAKEYDIMRAVMINLSDDVLTNPDSDKDIIYLLSTLFSSNLNANDRNKILVEDFEFKNVSKLAKDVDVMGKFYDAVKQREYTRGIERGMERGIELTKVDDIISVMSIFHVDMTAAMKALNVPTEEYPVYSQLVENKLAEKLA